MLKKIALLFLIVNISACSVTTKRKSPVDHPDGPVDYTEGEGAEPIVPEGKIPKIGILLGPGGARSYAYIGFLRELEKAKIPIHSISGLEWGALMGALYSINGKAHEVEWKASKIPDDFNKKGLLSSGVEARPYSEVEPYLVKLFESSKIDNGKIPFYCLTDNLRTFKSMILSRGSYKEAMRYCLPYTPSVLPYKSWASSALEIRYLIDYLSQKGADYLVLVDVVTDSYPLKGIKTDESTTILWSNVTKSLLQNRKYVHKAVSIPINKNILDFKSRKEFILQGEKTGKEVAAQIAEQFGL